MIPEQGTDWEFKVAAIAVAEPTMWRWSLWGEAGAPMWRALQAVADRNEDGTPEPGSAGWRPFAGSAYSA